MIMSFCFKKFNCTDKIVEKVKHYLKDRNQNFALNMIFNSNEYKDKQELALFNYYCTKIYREANEIASLKATDIVYKDLFIEQLVLCSILGFEDFLNDKWSNLILRFQQKNGCFG